MLLLANIVIDVTALFTTVLLYISGKRDQNTDYSQTLFERMLICIIAYLMADAFAWALEGKAFYLSRAIQMTLNSMIYMAQIVLSYLWLTYTDYYIHRSTQRLRKRRAVYLLPLMAEVVLIAVNTKTGWVFGVSSENFYVRGPFFLLSMLVFWGYGVCSLIMAAKGFFTACDRQRKTYCLWMAVFMFFPSLAAMLLAFGFYGVTVTAPSFALSVFMIYLNVHHKRLEEERIKNEQAQRELTESRMSIMLSQIQPHFLYNALGSIQRLCRTNPDVAEKATIDFSLFLRGNMDSLTCVRPIAFERELEHTRHYLSLERLRFPDALNVVWKIGPTLFRVPTLTLQPIVENAVRYGVTKKEEGGTVEISTSETPGAFVITVADDGVGYDLSKPQYDGRTHIGIDNVRSRLARMVGGTLEIDSAPGKGTVAVITIPKENENDDLCR